MKWILCLFSGHVWKGISWKPNGKVTASWSMRVVPEYDREEVCERCQKRRVEQYISSIDLIKLKRSRH